MEEILTQLEGFKSRIPVNPEKPIKLYIDLAKQLKLRGVQFYKSGKVSEAYIDLASYEVLIKKIREQHPDARTQPWRKEVFSLMHDMAVVKGVMAEAATKIADTYRQEEEEYIHQSHMNDFSMLKASVAPQLDLSRITERRMQIPRSLIDSFLAIADVNTEANIETLGFLAGEVTADAYTVNAVIIPSQRGLSDQCECSNDMEVYEALQKSERMILGWIHTHPQHRLFLSAIDLHTHSNYQALLPDAIAIVYAPEEPQTLGTFRLTEAGMNEVQGCSQPGFHPHARSIYEEVQNVDVIDGNVPFEIIDLRK